MTYEGPPPTVPPPCSGPLPYGNPARPDPTGKRPRSLVPRLLLGVLALVLVVAGSTALLTRSSRSAPSALPSLPVQPQVASYCPAEKVPTTASAAARALLAAQDSVRPAQLAVSQHLSDSGLVTSLDMTDQIALDRRLRSVLATIDFPATARAAATQYRDALTGYDNFLNLSASSASYYVSHQDDDAEQLSLRSTSEDQLRIALGLPIDACDLNRP